MKTEIVVDVRELVPREKHPAIFRAWDALPVGGVLKLVNDHNPKPLFYEFCAEREGEFQWHYLEEGPERWVVEITRTGLPKPSRPGAAPKSTLKRYCIRPE